MRWIVTRKFSPVMIDEKPTMNAPRAVRITSLEENMLLYGV